MSEVTKPFQMPAQKSKEHAHAKHKEEEGEIFTINVEAIHQWRREHHGKIQNEIREDAKERYSANFYIGKGTNCANRYCQKIA